MLKPLIHIGHHKTSTTTLQKHIFSNESIFYPLGRFGNGGDSCRTEDFRHLIWEGLYLDQLSSFAYDGEIPLAISFITFTAIAAIVDTKNKIFDRDSINFYSISEFILFFPQLIAGPILRLNELIPQLRNKIIFKKENIKFGLILFSIGFIKKIFFADNIGIFIDPIFEDPKSFSNVAIFKSFILFPLQIYFDFSGYVDMALGSSMIIGIVLPINFNKPYLTGSTIRIHSALP